MAANPVFYTVPRIVSLQLSVANAGRDGSGTLSAAVAAIAAGSMFLRYRITAAVTTTAGMVRCFISTDNGATKRLLRETPVSAVTVAANTPAFSATEVFEGGLQMPGTAFQLFFSTEKGEAINVEVEIADAA